MGMLRHPDPELALQQLDQIIQLRDLPPLALAAEPVNRKAAVVQRAPPTFPVRATISCLAKDDSGWVETYQLPTV